MMMMSVELAIQRELAYREKIAKLLLSPSYHDGPLLEDLIPFEGQSSTGSPSPCPMLSEITWQAPTNDLKFNLPPPQLHETENQIHSTSFKVQPTSPNPSPSPSAGPYSSPNPSPSPRPFSSSSPMLSEMKILSPANSIKFSPPPQLHEHENKGDYTFCKVQSSSLTPNQRENSSSSPMLSGIKREAPTNSLEFLSSSQPDKPENQMDYTFCKVCQVPCMSFFNYKQHIKGKKHRSKLQELKFKEELEDRKHKDEQANSRLGSGSEMKRPKYWCNLCNIWCTDTDLLTQHNEGKKHILKLLEIEKKKATLGH